MKKSIAMLALVLSLGGSLSYTVSALAQSDSSSTSSQAAVFPEQPPLSKESEEASQEYMKKYTILADGKRVGNPEDGYVNLPKDWKPTDNPDEKDKRFHYYVDPTAWYIVVLKKYTVEDMTVDGKLKTTSDLADTIHKNWQKKPEYVEGKRIEGAENSVILDFKLKDNMNRVMLLVPAEDGGCNYVMVEGAEKGFTELTKAVTGSYDQKR